MYSWSLVAESASIVLLGDFNPKIFHPEWYIRKGLVEEWDYNSEEKLVVAKEVARFGMPEGKTLQVLPSQFSISTKMASSFLPIKDIATGTFSILAETPLQALGMNYSAVIAIDSNDGWLKFGTGLAPKSPWLSLDELEYFNGLNGEKQAEMGLWELEINLPRYDEYEGQIRPKIQVVNTSKRQLSISINNHIDLSDEDTFQRVIQESWSKSLQFADSLVKQIIRNQLG